MPYSSPVSTEFNILSVSLNLVSGFSKFRLYFSASNPALNSCLIKCASPLISHDLSLFRAQTQITAVRFLSFPSCTDPQISGHTAHLMWLCQRRVPTFIWPIVCGHMRVFSLDQMHAQCELIFIESAFGCLAFVEILVEGWGTAVSHAERLN